MIATSGSRSFDDVARRLEEAEATIEALLSGQIDAVLDADSKSPVLLASAQDALRHSEERYRTIVETASEGIWTLDENFNTTFVNRRLAEMLGYRADAMIGRSVLDFAGKRSGASDARLLLQYSLHNASEEHEVALARNDGSELCVLLKSSPIRQSASQDDGTLVMLTDITERKRAAERLQAFEDRTRFALEVANVGVWDADFVTETARWSEQLEAQYGLKPGTFGGTLEAFISHIHPEDRAEVIEKIAAAGESGLDFSMSNRAIWPDGSVHWLTNQGRVELGAHGEPLRGTGISQDVTERRALEQQFQQAQKMEAVGRLAGGVAHDFNNLLSVIMGWTELVLADLPADSPIRDSLDEVLRAAAGATSLTKQLLAFSRQQIVKPSVFDPNDVVVETQKMLRRLIGEDVKLVTRLDPGLGRVKMDQGQLEQVIVNLVVNSRDAMPMGGTVTVETKNVALDRESARTAADLAPGDYIVLSVSDTGSGMSTEVQARLFEPFFTTKESNKGTGLGLATSYGIVKQAGGHIAVDSTQGAGSTMSVFLPRSMAITDPSPGTAAATSRGTELVLLVEDDLAVRRVTTGMLKSMGYSVISVGSGEEALKLLSDGLNVQLLLTDVVLAGGMNGPALVREVRAQWPRLSVLFASGYTSDAASLRDLLDSGAEIVEKPFTANSLGRSVRHVLDARSEAERSRARS